ncbi:MAG TPA: GNAT family N-acetyltransferase [bacterium]|nr:GNAT family N-acetyltransferase [bacterium]
MSEVIVRQAKIEDSAEIVELVKGLEWELTADEVAGRLKQVLEKPSEYGCFIAEDEGRLVGFANAIIKIEMHSGYQARVDGIVVDDNCRGKGVGRKLMEVLENWAKENGSKTMKLNSNVKRIEAHQFYEKIGYTKAKEQASFKKTL